MSNKYSNENDELEILLDRVKEVIGTKKDNAVAKALNIGTSTISTWKKRGGYSKDPFIDFALENNISLDWLFYGKSPMMIDAAAEEVGEYDSFDPEALEIAIECVELYTHELDLQVSPAKKAKVIRMLYPAIRDDKERPEDDNIIDLLKLAAETEQKEGDNEQQEEQVAQPNQEQG